MTKKDKTMTKQFVEQFMAAKGWSAETLTDLDYPEYGALVCGVARHIADAIGVNESAIWEWAAKCPEGAPHIRMGVLEALTDEVREVIRKTERRKFRHGAGAPRRGS
jgi:hypothetical protein